MSSNSPKILRPTPRRPFDQNAAPHQPPSPLLSPSNSNIDETPSRTHSILNLTSSTLLGIYSPTGYQADREEPSTPWGTGAETPASPPARLPIHQKKSSTAPSSTATRMLSLGLRSILLFALGMLYGLLVRHLHDDRQLAPFQVEGIIKPSSDWTYLLFWGVAGVALGSLLPWVDTLWSETMQSPTTIRNNKERSATPDYGSEDEELNSDGIFGADWTPVVRSVGAFVGIAFAIVCCPTQFYSRSSD